MKDYINKKEAKNNQITSIINIFKNSIKCLDSNAKSSDDQKEEEDYPMKDLILESAMFPTLESALSTGSLLEMAKEIDLYKSYLDLVRIISEDVHLSYTLLDIGNEYIPQQR